ncbi:hypothetical protein RB601_000211 [Gaeumannomyces tritici]
MATPSTMDLSAITSSAQVFTSPQNTLLQIRAIHKALHVEIDDRAARLRTQVGSSYRDLLGTADAIVRMRRDMQQVQATLDRMGGRCGRAVVGAKVEGLRRFDSPPDADADAATTTDRDLARSRRAKPKQMSVAARTRLLDACALSARRVLRVGLGPAGAAAGGPGSNGDRLLVAAKALLLGRLVGKSLSDAGEAVDPQVKASIESSWKSLLASIEAALERASEAVVDRDDVLKALCAHSLARNAGAREVLGYFLRARGRAMAVAFELEDDDDDEGGGRDGGRGGGGRDRGPAAVLDCLGLYTRTLLDVQALVPGRLSDALRGLKKAAIVEDEALLGLESLRLDVTARWCGDEIRYYRPYIRHDDLDGKQAREMLAGWAEKGGETLLGGLGKTLGQLHDFRSTIELRTQVLQGWIRDGGRVRGFDPAAMLDGLRGAVNARLLQMLADKVHKLRLVGSEVSATLDGWHQGSTGTGGPGLWDDDDDHDMDLDLAGGAASFTHDVVSRLYGRNDAVSKAANCYRSWHRVIDDVGDVVGQLRRQRWDNDVDEVEDEETIEHRQQLLSRDDPQLLHDRLGECLREAFAELDAEFGKLWAGVEGGGGEQAVYFIRVLRDVRSRLPDVEKAKALGLSLIPALHDRVARTAAQSPLAEFSGRALTRRTVAGRALWEGADPDLPTSPSPGALGLLRDLAGSMQESGTDVWSPAAVAALKAHLRKRLREVWTGALRRTEQPEQEGKSGDKTDDPSSDHDDGGGAEKPDGVEEKASSGEEENPDGGDAQAEDAPATEQDDAGREAPMSLESRRDLLVQWTFDIALLRCSMGAPPDPSSQDELEQLEEDVYQRSGLESGAARQRLARSAQEYWKRTNLLFGLLA